MPVCLHGQQAVSFDLSSFAFPLLVRCLFLLSAVHNFLVSDAHLSAFNCGCGHDGRSGVGDIGVTLINPLNAELNPICCLLALLRAHDFLHVNRIRVKLH